MRAVAGLRSAAGWPAEPQPRGHEVVAGYRGLVVQRWVERAAVGEHGPGQRVRRRDAEVGAEHRVSQDVLGGVDLCGSGVDDQYVGVRTDGDAGVPV
jgi:hypothetical protein